MKKLLFGIMFLIPSILYAQTRLSFGYECGDRFLIQNNGAQPVTVKYLVAGAVDTSQLHLNVGESKEIASAQKENLELIINGKIVASEPKGNKACPTITKDSVIISPISQTISPSVVYSTPDCTYYWMGCYPYYYSPIFPFYGRVVIGNRGFIGGRGVVGHRHR